ncbi:MAG: AI-2E family transporter [Cyclobacteriaceae bacterium]|nr:AI-2E family transporter [Cyclobacteriaceae bacterium]
MLDRIYKSLMVLALAITGLILLRDIVLPIAFAALLAVVLLPVSRRIELRTGRVFSIILTLLLVFVVMVLAGWFVIDQIADLVASLPDIEQRFYQFINQFSTTITEEFHVSIEEQTQLLKDGLKALGSSLTGLLMSTTYLAYFFIQVPIYIFLFLLYRDKLKEFVISLRPQTSMAWKKEVDGVIRGYISGLLIVVLIAGALNSIGLLLLGIEHAIFFGFLSGFLTVIPYVGITVGAALPAMFALLTKESAWYAVGVIGIHAFVQFLEGNFITPRITGSRISVNAMGAILALLLGGKILGIPGMILAVPTLGVVKILLLHTPGMRPFALVLGDEPPAVDPLPGAAPLRPEEDLDQSVGV